MVVVDQAIALWVDMLPALRVYFVAAALPFV
jgi:hypothetical protein